MPEQPATVTPGQAAYEAWQSHRTGIPDVEWHWGILGADAHESWEAAADAAIDAALPLRRQLAKANTALKAERDELRALINAAQPNNTYLGGVRLLLDEREKLRQQLAEAREVTDKALAANERWAATLGDVQQRHTEVKAERDAAREELADAKALLRYWPLCPDGCGCRLGVTGPDGENDADARDCACDGPCCIECRENGYPDAPSYRDIAVKHVMDDLTEASAIIEALREDHGRTDRYRQALEAARRALSSIALGTTRDPSVAADNAAVEIGRALDGQHG